MTTATQADVTYLLKNLQREFEYAGLPFAHLAVENGSRTYGRAFRLYYVDPITHGLADVPGMHSSFLGWTKSETIDTLHHIAVGMMMARKARTAVTA